MKRRLWFLLLALIAVGSGLVVLSGYFFPDTVFAIISRIFLDWFVTISAFALVVGVLYLLQFQWKLIRHTNSKVFLQLGFDHLTFNHCGCNRDIWSKFFVGDMDHDLCPAASGKQSVGRSSGFHHLCARPFICPPALNILCCFYRNFRDFARHLCCFFVV